MIRQIKNMDFETFERDLDVVVSKIVNSDNNFEDTYESYRQDAEYLLNRYCPLKTKKVKKSKVPLWMDEEYKKARSERQKLERIWKKSKSEENHHHYVEQRTLCAQLAISKKGKLLFQSH